MAYSLAEFCDETRDTLRTRKVSQALPYISVALSRLLGDPAFVSETFNHDMLPGRRILHHDPDTDFYVLAHVQEARKSGKPHSHGKSWAIYGNAFGVTQMTEWRRINPETDDHAELAATNNYSLGPGQTQAYGPGVIHSTAHPKGAWVIRVTGTDLDKLPRYHFGKADRIVKGVRS